MDKTRSVPSGGTTIIRGNYWTDLFGPPTTKEVALFDEHQTVRSFGNPYFLLGKTNSDIGGPFLSHKISVSCNYWEGECSAYPYAGQTNNPFYKGRFYASTEAVDLLRKNRADLAGEISSFCPTSVSDANLDAFGTTAISRIAPTNPLVDASETLGELRTGVRGLPSIPGAAFHKGGLTLKELGSEYLNWEFGVKPTASDLKGIHESATRAEEFLEQLERDSGKRIRRSYEPPKEALASSTQTDWSAPVSPDGSAGQASYALNGNMTKVVTGSKRTWFDGCFMYHLPKDGWRRKLRELDYLYGIQPGADTIWNLVGFSWLADWFGNFGDVLKNLNSFAADGLIMPFGYVMCHQVRQVSYNFPSAFRVGGGDWVPFTLSSTITYETKQRRPANPFGFGLTDADLNPRQWAILAALGISRG